MQPHRVVIIANGELRDPAYYRTLLGNDDFIICVNGGSSHALALDVQPHLLIGDLDSLSGEEREKISAYNPQILEYPVAKDKSDLELAIDYAVNLKPASILIIAALGGTRIEHQFLNLLLLAIPLKNGIPALIADETHEIQIIDSDTVMRGEPGDFLSLFALTGQVQGITTKGLKFPLSDEVLNFASSRGLSNEFVAGEAEVKIDTGMLLLIKSSHRHILQEP